MHIQMASQITAKSFLFQNPDFSQWTTWMKQIFVKTVRAYSVNFPAHLGANTVYWCKYNVCLCPRPVLIGIVESVSPHSVVFSAVLKIHGRSAAVKALPSPYVLKTHDHCNSPKLIPGEIYFFDEVNFFIDFNHASSIQSLHFIMSKCYRR